MRKFIVLFLMLLCYESATSQIYTLCEKWVDCGNGCKLLDPYYKDGVTFSWTGDCVNGKADGYGKAVKYVNGEYESTYEGYYKNGIREGKGKFSHKDGTIKFLFKLLDNNIVEGVLMQYKYGNTICISTQVGCAMGCSFCASGIDGKIRSLTAGEMVGEVLAVNKYLGGSLKEDRKITNIVLMGSGEPLDNYDNVIKFRNRIIKI